MREMLCRRRTVAVVLCCALAATAVAASVDAAIEGQAPSSDPNQKAPSEPQKGSTPALTQTSPCESDLTADGRVDADDLKGLAASVGRADCGVDPGCVGDGDHDRDVDGLDAARLAGELGRDDCLPPQDPFEPNNDVASAAPIDCPTQITEKLALALLRDVDFFKFPAVEGHSIVVETSGPLEGMPDTMLQLRDPDQIPLAFNDDIREVESLFSQVAFIAPRSGQYLVGVASYDDVDFNGQNAQTTGFYRLSVTCTPVAPDPFEPNNTSASATSIECPKEILDTLVLAPLGDVDYFQFSASAGESITVETHGPYDGAPDTMLKLWDPDGAEMVLDDDSGQFRFSKIVSKAAKTGTYTVAVTSIRDLGFDGGPDASTTGVYHLRVGCETAP